MRKTMLRMRFIRRHLHCTSMLLVYFFSFQIIIKVNMNVRQHYTNAVSHPHGFFDDFKIASKLMQFGSVYMEPFSLCSRHAKVITEERETIASTKLSTRREFIQVESQERHFVFLSLSLCQSIPVTAKS